jgi:hypothetical protein
MEVLKTIDSIFIDKNSLLDTRLEEILINKDNVGELQILLTFTNFRLTSDFKRVQICFKNIEVFCFQHSKDYNFYNVENYKLLKSDGKIYISLDPDESTESRSKDDLDFILAEKATIIE